MLAWGKQMLGINNSQKTIDKLILKTTKEPNLILIQAMLAVAKADATKKAAQKKSKK